MDLFKGLRSGSKAKQPQQPEEEAGYSTPQELSDTEEEPLNKLTKKEIIAQFQVAQSMMKRQQEQLSQLIALNSRLTESNNSNSSEAQSITAEDAKEDATIAATMVDNLHIKHNSQSVASTRPAAIDSKLQLPKASEHKLISDSPTPEYYLQWRDDITNAINAIPRYSVILLNDPDTSWQLFRSLNTKYANDLEFMEQQYLEANLQLWNFLTGTVSHNIKGQLTEEIKLNNANNLLDALQFMYRRDSSLFYQNAYAFISGLDDRFRKNNDIEFNI